MKAILSLVILLALTGCASQQDKREVREEAKESNVSNVGALGETITDLIQNSKTLTEAQKKELSSILAANKAKADALSAESFKFRSVLIRELLSGKVDPKKIVIIKNDIKKIENDKLKNTFDAVEKISNIVSNHPENEKYINSLIFIDRAIAR